MRRKYAILEFNHKHRFPLLFNRVLISYTGEPDISNDGGMIFENMKVLATDPNNISEERVQAVYFTVSHVRSDKRKALYCAKTFQAATPVQAKKQFYSEN